MAIKLRDLMMLMGFSGDRRIDCTEMSDGTFTIGHLEDGTYTYTDLASGRTTVIDRINLNRISIQHFWAKNVPINIMRAYGFPPEYDAPLMFKNRTEERRYKALHEDERTRIFALNDVYGSDLEASDYSFMTVYCMMRVWCCDHGIEYIDNEWPFFLHKYKRIKMIGRDIDQADYEESVDYDICRSVKDESIDDD